jgi:2-polyprenyl-3-methyl-5-hydroxy-6-metoxy-1,4-benzoquinol methylase
MESITYCPVCGSDKLSHILKTIDYTVSQEAFSISQCEQCTVRFTVSAPSTVNIGKYYQSEQYISHTNSKQGLFNKLYQIVRNYSLVSKRKLVCSYANKRSGLLLDYGCGTGSFLNEMKLNGWTIKGVEPDAGAALKAKMLTGSEIGDSSSLNSLENDSFDVITLWHVLEHVHELHPTVKTLKQKLRTNGVMFVAVPNYQSFDATYYDRFWAAYDVPRHLYHFSKKSMANLMEANGLKIVNILPMWFDSFYVSLLSEKYKKNPLGPIIAFFIGMISNVIALFKGNSSSLIYVIKPA